MEQVLDQQKVPDTNRFYISIASDRLRNASNAFHLTALEWWQNGLRAQTLLDNLSKMLNSNEQFEMDDSFNLSVMHVRPLTSIKGFLGRSYLVSQRLRSPGTASMPAEQRGTL